MSNRAARPFWRGRGFDVALASLGVLVALVLTWLGVNDWRIPGHAPSGTPSSTTMPSPDNTPSKGEGAVLASDSPVKVRWLGRGDAIDVTWDAMNYPGLHSYDLQIFGVSPLETWYSEGYRLGEELRTSATTYPVAETNEKFADLGSQDRVTKEETWRVCVTGMKEVPLGVPIAPYVITGSKQCSDLFVLP